jgi:hypothetical protein
MTSQKQPLFSGANNLMQTHEQVNTQEAMRGLWAEAILPIIRQYIPDQP